MKRNFIYILLLIWLVADNPVAYGQEARLTGTLKMHPWVNLPVVISSDIKGGMQTLGILDLTTPATILNTTIPASKRDIGMIVSVIDKVSNQTRFFQYTATTDVWREVYVTQSWEAGHTYAIGDFVSYNSNYYIANAPFTSSTLFASDINWNRAGGKDAGYDVSKLYLNGSFVSKVAKGGDVVTTPLLDSTLVTAGYVSQATSNSSFTGTKAITRPGWVGVTGFPPNASTVVDFLNKVFYPVSPPFVNYFNYNSTTDKQSYESIDGLKVVTDYPGSTSIPYSAWNLATNLTFNYGITNRSVADGDNKKITKVELFKGSTSLLTNAVGNITTPLPGSFSVPKTNFTTSVSGNSANIFMLRVTDEASNVVNLNLTTNLSAALGVTVSSARISTTSAGAALTGTGSEGGGSSSDPYLIERTGNTLNYFLVWALTPNDDVGNITNIAFTGTSEKPTDLTGSNLLATNAAISIPNLDRTQFQMSVTGTGSLVNIPSTAGSAYYQLTDRTYCGYLSSNVAPTAAQIIALQTSSLKTTTYAAGISPTNSTGGSAFFTWAVPTYVDGSLPAPTASGKTPFYQASSVWYTNTNINSYYIKMTPPGGSAASWYWICIYNASAPAGGVTIVKLS